MKLFLASEAKHPKSIEKLKNYIGGFEGKKIAYIPTASNGELPWGEWKNGGTWNLINTFKADIQPILLEDFNSVNFPKSLEDKDIIWMAGGACGYLMYWIKRTKLDIYLSELLKKDILYVGSSAGSMITAPTLNICEWYIGEEERGASYLPGLGLVDFDFYPHYEDELLPQIEKQYRGSKMYLVKNGEAILVEDSKITALGEEKIISKNI